LDNINSYKNRISEVPKKPGVYFHSDENKKIIYVGKANSLNDRLKFYFSDPKDVTPKVSELIAKIKDFDYIVTESEQEALLLENQLIKKYQPKYNARLKDDKTYPYIRITKEKYPKVEIVRFKHFNKDNHLYFGPYTKARDLRGVIKLLYKVFPIKTCDLKQRESCFCNFCMSKELISKEKYSDIINQVIDFLKGKTESVVKYLKFEMQRLSDGMDYEKAAILRDQILLIKDSLRICQHLFKNV